MKRYIFKVKYRDKVIDKIHFLSSNEDNAINDVNTIALENFRVELEEVIDE